MTCTIIPRVEAVPEFPPSDTNREFVIIDVLNFSTTVIYLLRNGAEYVRTYNNKKEALEFKRTVDNAVLVGEQEGIKPDGFDYNNLPSEIEDVSFDGQPVGVMSSNGTRAVETVGKHETMYIGSTVNAEAVASIIRKSDKDIYLVAAGKFGEQVAEDLIGAEMIQTYYNNDTINEETLKTYSERIRSSRTADHFRNLGFEEEIEKVLEYNSSNIVPKIEDGDFIMSRDN